jgi:hypothetical protein
VLLPGRSCHGCSALDANARAAVHIRNIFDGCWSPAMPLLHKRRCQGGRRRWWCESSLINSQEARKHLSKQDGHTKIRQASSERRLQCTNTLNRQQLNNHASGPFQIEDGACKHWYLIHLLVRLSIHGLRSSAHNCGRNRCSPGQPGSTTFIYPHRGFPAPLLRGGLLTY